MQTETNSKLKVLWFANTSSLYEQGTNHYNGCGWVESLEQIIRINTGIDLAVSFFHPIDNGKVFRNSCLYYPMKLETNKRNSFQKLVHNWSGSVDLPDFKVLTSEVISDFNPDVIHVFGTESVFSDILSVTTIPVVFHLQGLINPCLNSYFPIKQSVFNFYFNSDYFFNNLKGNSPAFEIKRFKNQALREVGVLRRTEFVMGRTTWDNMVVKTYNPDINYFHIDEVLRPAFYDQPLLSRKVIEKLKIISTISPTVYKGIDVVLKCANLLKNQTSIDFEWCIVGLDSEDKMLKHFEKEERIKHTDVNLVLLGKKNSEELVVELQKADLYIHPSYIDNSPNSVCEAQMLGLPVIACNVGGLSSLIEDCSNGFLVPSNGIFEMVNYIKLLSANENLRFSIGKQAKVIAEARHNKQNIVEALLNVYCTIKDLKQ